jgi:hypothetical protein
VSQASSKPTLSFQMAPLALGVMDAAQALNCSWDYFAEHVMPDLKVVCIGRKKLIAVSELQAWLDRNGARILDDERLAPR